MVLVDTSRFLNELGRLFEKAKAKDSVSITLKRSEALESAPLTERQQVQRSRIEQRAYLTMCMAVSAGNLKPRKSKKSHEVYSSHS